MLQSTKIGMATRNGKSLTRCCYYSKPCLPQLRFFSHYIHTIPPYTGDRFQSYSLGFSIYSGYSEYKGIIYSNPHSIQCALLQSCRSIRFRYAFRNRTARLLFPFSIAYPKIKHIQNRFIFSLKV